MFWNFHLCTMQHLVMVLKESDDHDVDDIEYDDY